MDWRQPWLYHIAPADARGRLVGFHETLIAFAPIVAPVLASFFGLCGSAIFWMGVAMRGLVIALLGGMMEAALSGLFVLFAQDRGLEVTQITELLTPALIASTLATSGNIARNVSIASMLNTASAAAVLGWPRGLTRFPT